MVADSHSRPAGRSLEHAAFGRRVGECEAHRLVLMAAQ
jgi:hypothetical protein